jgi:predicted nucleic acid-binding protein
VDRSVGGRVRRTVIVDTSALLAYFDSIEPDHAAVAAIFETTR